MRASSVIAPSSQRDVEVHADEDALALDVEVVKRAHAPARLLRRAPRSGSSSPTRCRTRTTTLTIVPSSTEVSGASKIDE